MAFIRNGKWCQCEHSFKHLLGGKEEGVSVYEADDVGGGVWRPTGPAWSKRLKFVGSAPIGGDWFLVEGRRLDRTGADEEPLLRDVTARRALTWDEQGQVFRDIGPAGNATENHPGFDQGECRGLTDEDIQDDLYGRPEFAVVVQGDKLRGCIPACAISVLKYLRGDPPKEAELISRMAASSGSGFERLRGSLPDWDVVVEEDKNRDQLLRRVEELVEQGELVLVALRGSPAHCVVVEDAGSGIVTYHDPDDGNVYDQDADEFKKRMAADLAVIRRR